MDDPNSEAVAIGATCLVLALIAAVCHATLLVSLVLHKRHSASRNTAYAPNSLYTRSRVHPRKRNVSSYFFVSLWLCLVLHLVTRLAHDIPSTFVGSHVLGSNIASLVAWATRCLFYSAILHTVLIVGSGYCNRFDFGRSNGLMAVRCTCLASKMRATLVTLASWLLSVAAATIVKYSVCEYQFDPRLYGYTCVHTIHYEGNTEKPSTQSTKEETKRLLYVDGTILGVATLWLMYANWAIRKLTMKRRRLVEQANSAISMDSAFSSALEQPAAMSQERSQIARMRSNRLIALTSCFVVRSVCYILVIDLGQNRWHFFTYTFFDYAYLIACPIAYIVLTKPLQVALSSYRRPREAENQIALSAMSRAVGDDDHSLFSFTQAPAPFASPAVDDRISTASLTRVAEKSPFTADTQLNNSPSVTSGDLSSGISTQPDQYLEPQRNRPKSSTRYLTADSARNARDRGSTVSVDVHRSDIYAISSFQSFGQLQDAVGPTAKPDRNGSAKGARDSVLGERNGNRAPATPRKRYRRPVRFLRQRSPDAQQTDQAKEQAPASPGVSAADVDSTASDTSSLQLTRAVMSLSRRNGWTKQDSMENYETNGSLKERAAAARKFVEAYEAKNARLQHSLATEGRDKKTTGVVALGDFEDVGNFGLSAIDEGIINAKKMPGSMNMEEYENRTNETRCYHDG